MAKDRNKPKTTTGTAPPRSRTVERRRERERERRRQQLITGGVIVVALIAVIVVVVLIVRAPADAPIPTESLTRYTGVNSGAHEGRLPASGRRQRAGAGRGAFQLRLSTLSGFQ